MFTVARLFNRRAALSAVVLLFVMSVAYAFAATNTVPDSGAGDGAGAISGYAVSNVRYLLEDGDSDPTDIDSLSFTLADNTSDAGVPQAPSTVRVRLSTTGAYASCAMSGWNATCTGLNHPVVDALELRVIAAQ